MPKISGCLGIVSQHRLTHLRIVVWLILTLSVVSLSEAAGPLTAHPTNPRYFADSSGNAIYLSGAYLKNSLIDRTDEEVLDFSEYLDFLQEHNHNFIRLWVWEQAAWTYEKPGKVEFDPLPYQRTGPGAAIDGGLKFDLTRFNQAYFDRLRSRVVEAGQRGIYVSVMLFQGFSSQATKRRANPWAGHPFHHNNNINGINGDPDGDGSGEEVHSLVIPSITALQEAYVRKVVDTLNDLDNVLYEISGEAASASKDWQYYIINYLKIYQATKAKQHPVGMSHLYLGNANDLAASPADWILLPGTDVKPAVAAGQKVILSDMNPNLLTGTTSYELVWKSFMRGLNPIYLESALENPSATQHVRNSMGYALSLSQLVDLSSMSPSTTLCSTRYCLGKPGVEYLVYLPSGSAVTVNLAGMSGSFVAHWFNPITGEMTSGGTVNGGSEVLLTSPIGEKAVLYLRSAAAAATTVTMPSGGTSTNSGTATFQTAAPGVSTVSTPTVTPNGGNFTGSASVTIQTATAGASIFYTTNGTTPTQSSTLYTKPFTLSTTTLVKAKAFKSGANPSGETSAWFTIAPAQPVQLNLTWKDNSTNENGFQIDRKTGTNGTYVQIASVTANTNSYLDTGLANGTTYCYRVRAVNNSQTSGYTNDACATTFP
jgi:hypothetical protein